MISKIIKLIVSLFVFFGLLLLIIPGIGILSGVLNKAFFQ